MSLFSVFKKNLMTINTLASKAGPLHVKKLDDDDYVGMSRPTRQQTILQRNVEKVTNIDEKIIELTLKSENARIEPTAGFLVEVFASGSDGKLTRLFQHDLTDLHGNVTEEGFSNFLVVTLDK